MSQGEAQGPLTVATILSAKQALRHDVEEPEVSASERRLHGQLAEPVMLLREAATAIELAVVLALTNRWPSAGP